MKKILISIIIPTKNAAGHLDTLFASLKKQTFKNFEVIVNDDKSTDDNTKTVIKKYKKDLKIIYMQDNKMMAQARKSGAKKASGRYLYHIDADMSLTPKVLSQCVDKMKGGKCDALIIPEESYGEGFWSKVKSFERSFYIGDDTMESVRFFKKEVYWDIGGHNEKMVASEDKDVHLRTEKKGYKICRIKAKVMHNEGNLSLIKTMKKKFFYGKSVNVFINAHPNHARTQANALFRASFFKNYKKLLKNPWLTLGLFIMKFAEMLAVLTGYLLVKIIKG